MFPGVFQSRLTHLAVLVLRHPIPDKYGEHPEGNVTAKIKCFADGSKSSTLRSNGEDFNISFQVQFDKLPVIVPGDKLVEVKTKQGDVLFTDGIVRRVSELISPDQGVIGRLCSVQVKNT